MQKEFDEKGVVQQILSGNKRAFVNLIRQYEGLVLHIVTPLLGDSGDREDICQTVFLKVFEKLHTFKFKSKLGTWIGNIAYNESINFLQKKKNILISSITSADNENAFLEQASIEFENPEEIFIKEEELDQLSIAIDTLTQMQKTVLLLFYQDDLTLEEISIALEIPVNTVKSHLSRARNSLKQLIRMNYER
jgi:RNA polymerase sigma factor (sigma-70 family)